MILNRDDCTFKKGLVACSLLIATTLAFDADVGAQTGRDEDLGGARSNAAADARHYLESALSSDEGHVRFEALRGARTLREEWIGEVVLPLCESPNLTEQVLALEAVTETDPELARDLFLMFLEHEQRSVRLRALLGLERIGDPDLAPELIRVMESDPDLDLRIVAARALGTLKHPESSLALRRKITSHHAALREQVVKSLIEIGNVEVGDYLIRELEANRDLDTVETMRLLALVPDASLIERLSPYLESEDPLVRTHASITILSILERSGTGAP